MMKDEEEDEDEEFWEATVAAEMGRESKARWR